MTLIGRVYKLSNPKSEKVYIGSSYCKYLTIRLAHHRQNHRNKWKEYYGLFDNGDPDMEVLDTIELEDRSEAWKLRELEQKYVNEHDNCMNIRKCYLTQEEKNIQRELAVSRYQNSPSGKLSMRKSYLNQRLKNIKNKTTIKTIHPSVVKQIENEIKFISEQQKLIRENHKE